MSTSIFPQIEITSGSFTVRGGLMAQLNRKFSDIKPEYWRKSTTFFDVDRFCDDDFVLAFTKWIVRQDLYSEELANEAKRFDRVGCLKPLREMRFAFSLKLKTFISLCSELARELEVTHFYQWQDLMARWNGSDVGEQRLIDVLSKGRFCEELGHLKEELEETNPHAIYPTSSYRHSGGHVVANESCTEVEAVMSSQTHTSIRIVENSLDPADPTLSDVYKHLGRCVCLVDKNVEENYSFELKRYFKAHNIHLEKLVYRAMEIDKGIRTVEKILGDFKNLGVSRNEPVLVIGGGVLSDVGGLACGLYHRGTPYVMLSTSLVAGVDAGPSPRTCCDGFGFKNLFGAYHAPILSITDRTFFRTLKPGWLRHGIAEIIKMATVKDEELFVELELAGSELVHTRFGTTNCGTYSEIQQISQRIIGLAITSYVDAEYGNLYETHQCRPHAYGHTWSPGFEIPAGLLHGHAVAIGMGFGAYVSERLGWIDESQTERIHRLIQSFGLSMWHDRLRNHDLLWAAQVKMVEKRGGHLVAPLPKFAIGNCGYLEDLNQRDLRNLIKDYALLCSRLPNSGIGIEPLCSDVGLESPSTVGT